MDTPPISTSDDIDDIADIPEKECYPHTSKGLRFCVYIILLVLFSFLIISQYNIDLLAFWQGGHNRMLVLSLIPTALLLHTFTLFRRWAAIPLALWLLFVATQMYVLKMMNFRISFGIIANIFETDKSEAGNFINAYTILTVCILIIIAAFYGKATNYLCRGLKKWSRLLWGILFIGTILNFLCIPHKPSYRETALWPLNNIGEMSELLYRYWAQERPMMQSLKNLPSMAEPESSFVSHPEGLIVLLHLGESARADHWSVNGYPRPTTPFIKEEATTGNLINFPHTLSYAAGTRLSLVGMLTLATIENPYPTYGPIFPLFQKHKFALQAFRSNQKADDQIYDSTLITLTKAFKENTAYQTELAESVLPEMKACLSYEKVPNKFLLYYGEGSHAPYLYPPKYTQFVPDGMDMTNFNNTPQETINRYDNSIFATDQFIKQAIENLRDERAIYAYVGDHGEYLGENGCYNHGSNVMNDECIRQIPFFIWVSPRYEASAPEKVANLRKNAASLKVVSHNNVVHTLLGLSGIKSAIYDETQDLSSPNVKSYTGPMPQELPPHTVFETLAPK